MCLRSLSLGGKESRQDSQSGLASRDDPNVSSESRNICADAWPARAPISVPRERSLSGPKGGVVAEQAPLAQLTTTICRFCRSLYSEPTLYDTSSKARGGLSASRKRLESESSEAVSFAFGSVTREPPPLFAASNVPPGTRCDPEMSFRSSGGDARSSTKLRGNCGGRTNGDSGDGSQTAVTMVLSFTYST
jgi:hypothetical protein